MWIESLGLNEWRLKENWEVLNTRWKIQKEQIRYEYENLEEIRSEINAIKLDFSISSIKWVSLEKTWNNCVYYWLFDLFQKTNFWTDIDSYFDPKIEKLKNLWINESELNDYYLKKAWIFEILDKESYSMYLQIKNLIWKNNQNNIKSFQIINWTLRVIFNNNSSENFEIKYNDKKNGLKIVKIEKKIEDLRKIKEEKEKSNTRSLSYFWWALGLSIWVDLNKRYFLKEASFTDNFWRKHKVKIRPETKFQDIPDTIKEVLKKIEVENNFKIQKINWKEIFVENSKRVEISKLRNSVIKEFTFEKFKDSLPKGHKISEKELETEFEKIKYEMLKALDDVKKIHWEKVLPLDFLSKISWKSIHYLLFPIFFKEIHKSQSDLVSYFKWAWEYAGFTAWALTANKLINGLFKSLKILPKYSKTWIILYWTLQLVAWVLWWAGWIWLWAAWVKLAKLDKWFNKIVPENKDFLKKYLLKKNDNDNIALYWLSSFFMPDLADVWRFNIKLPFLPVVFWQHDVDFSTTKKEYMSSWVYRTPKEFNKRIDEFTNNLWKELKNIFEKNKDKKIIEQKIKKFIYNWKLWWEETINKELKDKIYSYINMDIDNILSWKRNLQETLWLIQAEIKNMKIDDNFMKELKQEIDNKEKIFLTALWEGWKSNNESSFIKEIPILNYIKKLPEKDRKYAYNYYKRVLNKEEVIQEWDYEHIKEWRKVYKKSIYDRLISDNTVDEELVDKNWKKTIITKWDRFNEFIWIVSELHDDKQFFERMKNDLGVIKPKEIEKNKIKEYKDWTKVEKINWGLKLIRNWKEIIINLFENWRLESIKIWNNIYKTNLNNFPDNLTWDSKPYIFLDKEEPFINIRRQDLDISSKYATNKKLTFDNLFKMLDWRNNITLIEDYDLFNDLLLEKVKK